MPESSAAPEPVFPLADFQADAVRRAERILSRWRGVIIADSVGLGKTFIALALIEHAIHDGLRVGVFTPAALRSVWLPRLRRLRRATPGAHVAWCSHARLSRGTFSARRLDGLGVVVVDEAHAFRNARTRRYRALAGLCAGSRVILITATPVNNSVRDLYSLLRLFAGRASFRELGIPDLYTAFRAAESDPGALLPVVRAVVIRRTRADVRDREARPQRHAGPSLTFPRRAPPRAVRYGVGSMRDLYDHALRMVDALDFAPFRWHAFAAGDHSPGSHPAYESELLRFLLLKRLESGLAAFESSIARQYRFHAAFLEALGRGRLLIPRDHRTLYGQGDDDAVQLVLESLALREVPGHIDRTSLARAASEDLERIAALRRKLRARGVARDPKVERLRSLLNQEIGDARAVVFTAFRDTADQLRRALLHERATALITGAGAWLGARPSGRRAVIRRFAPRANHAPTPHRRERVDILIATDVLAEGLDLHDAAHVISYDLPWNPVRLMQRVGRVDRLGSPHDRVHSYHFLPDDEVERRIGLLRRLRQKLHVIRGSVGAEGPVLGGANESSRHATAGAGPLGKYAGKRDIVDRLRSGDPDILDAIERVRGLPTSMDERLRAAYKTANPQPGRQYPVGSILVARASKSCGRATRALIALEIAGDAVWLIDRGAGRDAVRDEVEASRLLLRILRSPGFAAGGDSPPQRNRGRREGRAVEAEMQRALETARRALDRQLALTRATTSPPPGSPAVLAARQLRRGLARIPGGPPPDICARADRLLEELAHPHSAGTEYALRDALGMFPGMPSSAGGMQVYTRRIVVILEEVLARVSVKNMREEHEINGRILAVLCF